VIEIQDNDTNSILDDTNLGRYLSRRHKHTTTLLLLLLLFINVGVWASLRAPRLIPRALKLMIM